MWFFYGNWDICLEVENVMSQFAKKGNETLNLGHSKWHNRTLNISERSILFIFCYNHIPVINLTKIWLYLIYIYM